MAPMTNKPKYLPGMYAKKRTNTVKMADQYIHDWEIRRLAAIKEKKLAARVTNCICFSRKIGVGALEIADLLSEKIGFKVVDREILEHIANDRKCKQSTIDTFDERHPGAMNNFASMLFGEKAYTMGDYMRHLVSAVYSIADSDPTIFVGRAAHLILPRERVLAVRFISSREYRIKRVASILNVGEKAAEKELAQEDKKQHEFFKKNFKKKDAVPYEFDLVINLDYFTEPSWAADIVEKAYNLKFEK